MKLRKFTVYTDKGDYTPVYAESAYEAARIIKRQTLCRESVIRVKEIP